MLFVKDINDTVKNINEIESKLNNILLPILSYTVQWKCLLVSGQRDSKKGDLSLLDSFMDHAIDLWLFYDKNDDNSSYFCQALVLRFRRQFSDTNW